jgi:hypothetical protein
MHPIFILLILIAAVFAVRWYQNQSANKQPPDKFKLALYVAGAILLLALITGRLNPLIAVIAAAIPALQRLTHAKKWFDDIRTGNAPQQGNTSKIATAMLEMQLDHDSGELSGTVLKGAHAGSQLANLDKPQLLVLMSECQSINDQSAAVLSAYLDRRFGSGWRSGTESSYPTDPNSGSMSVKEAQEILGISGQASREEIITAHKKLIQKLHPDRGGSNYLATQVNQARDLLLARL